MLLVNPGLDSLSEDECWHLLGGASLGRIGVSVSALPVIFPVTFLLSGSSVRFWSAPGMKLHAAHAGNVVAFEVDEFDTDTQSGWSILAVGLAVEVVDPVIVDSAARDGLRPWINHEGSHLIEVRIKILSGRRMVMAAG